MDVRPDDETEPPAADCIVEEPDDEAGEIYVCYRDIRRRTGPGPLPQPRVLLHRPGGLASRRSPCSAPYAAAAASPACASPARTRTALRASTKSWRATTSRSTPLCTTCARPTPTHRYTPNSASAATQSVPSPTPWPACSTPSASCAPVLHANPTLTVDVGVGADRVLPDNNAYYHLADGRLSLTDVRPATLTTSGGLARMFLAAQAVQAQADDGRLRQETPGRCVGNGRGGHEKNAARGHCRGDFPARSAVSIRAGFRPRCSFPEKGARRRTRHK